MLQPQPHRNNFAAHNDLTVWLALLAMTTHLLPCDRQPCAVAGVFEPRDVLLAFLRDVAQLLVCREAIPDEAYMVGADCIPPRVCSVANQVFSTLPERAQPSTT